MQPKVKVKVRMNEEVKVEVRVKVKVEVKVNLHLSKLKLGRQSGKMPERNETKGVVMLRSVVVTIVVLVASLVK